MARVSALSVLTFSTLSYLGMKNGGEEEGTQRDSVPLGTTCETGVGVAGLLNLGLKKAEEGG